MSPPVIKAQHHIVSQTHDNKIFILVELTITKKTSVLIPVIVIYLYISVREKRIEKLQEIARPGIF